MINRKCCNRKCCRPKYVSHLILPSAEIFAESEVGDFDVAGGIEEKILQFQITVDKVVGVQESDGQHDFRHVKSSLFFGKTTLFEELIV